MSFPPSRERQKSAEWQKKGNDKKGKLNDLLIIKKLLACCK